ncbi:MAG: cation:proton antiporter [Phycisphaeraceae bacterium]|nr:cation:proton antiporter [Phycisphaeraceae bacterium]
MPLPFAILAQASSSNRLAIDLLAILSAAGLVALIARKINLATIPCYLIAGALVGPHALGLAGAGEGGTAGISSLATIMLMFIIGLQLDIGSLRGGLVSMALVTVIGSVACIALGWPVGLLFGLSSPGAISVAMAITISSTAVVLRIMEQKRELHLVQGRTTLGILVLQDMVALLLMASIPLLALWARAEGQNADANEPSVNAMISQASVSIGGIAAMVVLGRLVLPRLLRAAAFSQEVLLVVSAAVALASAVATSALKFSPELGAFLAGFLLASTPFRYQLAGMLAPMRDLFLAVFFTAIGLSISPALLLQHWWIVPLSVLATVVIKTLAIGVVGWACGASGPVAVYLGLAMAQGGEFSLVILAQSRTAGVLSDSQTSIAIMCVVLSLIITPNLMQLARRLMPAARRLPPAWWIRKSMLRDATAHPQMEGESAGAPSDAGAGPALGSLAIIAGFGPVGRAVADTLEKRGVIVTVIELNPRTVEKQHAMGRSIVYGDAGNPEVLHKAGLDRAEAIVLTMPDEEAVLRACRTIRQIKPDIFIAARLNVLSKALQAMQQGADHTVVEELATAEAMSRQVIIKLEQRAAGEDSGPKLYQLQG